MANNMKIGDLLRRHKGRTTMSQANLADQIGTCQSTYHAWENDKSLPNIEYFTMLAIAFQVDLRELIPIEFRALLPPLPNVESVQVTHEEAVRALRLTINLLQEKMSN